MCTCIHTRHINIHIYIYIAEMLHRSSSLSSRKSQQAVRTHGCSENTVPEKGTPNLPTNIVDFRGFDSSTILI